MQSVLLLLWLLLPAPYEACDSCTFLPLTCACSTPLIVQVVSRGRLQIVAGEKQNSNSVTKRRLTGGTGLPPIDGGVSCCFHRQKSRTIYHHLKAKINAFTKVDGLLCSTRSVLGAS
jgi:hypothetical protein